MSLAKITGMFRLTRDAELRYGQNGNAILKMGLACSEKFGDKETQLFIDATSFGKQAEIINQYAGSKGTQIFVSGKLQTEQWEKDGQKFSKNTMIIESFDFVSKGKAEDKPCSPPEPTYEDHPEKQAPKYTDYQPKQPEQKPTQESTQPSLYDESEIPF